MKSWFSTLECPFGLSIHISLSKWNLLLCLLELQVCTLHTAQCTLRTASANGNTLASAPVRLYYTLNTGHYMQYTFWKCNTFSLHNENIQNLPAWNSRFMGVDQSIDLGLGNQIIGKSKYILRERIGSETVDIIFPSLSLTHQGTSWPRWSEPKRQKITRVEKSVY